MELQLNYRFSLLITISAALAGCTKTLDFPTGESVNYRFAQSMEWNRSHPVREIVVQADNYTILAMADSHVGTTVNLDSFIKTAKAMNAAAVVMTGDLTSGHSEDYQTFENQLPAPDSMELFLMVGNHDLFFDGWEEFYTRFGASSYFFTVKTPKATDLIICLDTGGGTLGDEQMEWLKKVLLTMRPECRHCMVCTHNNFFRFNQNLISNPPVEELEPLIELFTKNSVEMVLTGHDHERNATLFGQTTYIQIGALKDGSTNAGYLQIGVKNDKVKYDFVDLEAK
jgi:predicted phosphodiesterase